MLHLHHPAAHAPADWFTEADVEAAARAICWADIGGARISSATDTATVLFVDANWHRHVYQARAALRAISNPRTGTYAEGYAAGVRDTAAAGSDMIGRWAEAAIVALRGDEG